MTWHLTEIPRDEIEDFEIGCRELGFDPRDFKISARENVPNEPGHIRRLVMLSRDSVVHDIEAGSGHDWIATALNAIKNGVYGGPENKKVI